MKYLLWSIVIFGVAMATKHCNMIYPIDTPYEEIEAEQLADIGLITVGLLGLIIRYNVIGRKKRLKPITFNELDEDTRVENG
jgi:hypothetical protein